MSLFDIFKNKKSHDELIGATDAELKALYNKEFTVTEIAEKIGSDLTDYTRASVL